MSLEAKVSAIVHQAHLLEKLVHGTGKWTATFVGLPVPVSISLTDTETVISVEVPGIMGGREGTIVIFYEGEEVLVRDIVARAYATTVEIVWEPIGEISVV